MKGYTQINVIYANKLYRRPVNQYESDFSMTGCFAIIILQMYCYYKYFVALPHSAVGLSAVCECGIS